MRIHPNPAPPLRSPTISSMNSPSKPTPSAIPISQGGKAGALRQRTQVRTPGTSTPPLFQSSSALGKDKVTQEHPLDLVVEKKLMFKEEERWKGQPTPRRADRSPPKVKPINY